MPALRPVLVPITAAAALALAGCASVPAVTAPHIAVSTDRPCPPPSAWLGATAAPTRLQSTPANTPQAEALSQAVGAEGRGAFADVYGTQITDFPVGRVALCVTDLARGRQLAAAAKRARPGIDLSRLDLYHCGYAQRTLDRAIARVLALGPTVLGFPLYTASPVQDASGIQVTTTAKGAHSAALQAALARAAGNGIPVRVDPGGPMRPA